MLEDKIHGSKENHQETTEGVHVVVIG